MTDDERAPETGTTQETPEEISAASPPPIPGSAPTPAAPVVVAPEVVAPEVAAPEAASPPIAAPAMAAPVIASPEAAAQGSAAPASATSTGPLAAQLRTLVSRPGLISAGIFAAVALGIALLSAVLILIAAVVSTNSTVDVGTAILALLVGAGWSLGSGVTGSLEGASFFGTQIEAGLTAHAFALGTLGAVGVAVAIFARIRTRADGTASAPTLTVVARSAIESAAIALLLTLVTAIPSVLLGTGGTGISVRSDGVGTFLVTLVVLLFALTAGRLSARRPATMPHLAGFGPALGEAGTMIAAFATVFGAVALIGGAVYLATNDQGIASLALLPFLGNAAGLVVALAALGGVTVSTSVASGGVVVAGDLLDGWGWLLPVLALVLLLALAIRIGARRGVTTVIRWSRVWQLPLISFGVWLLLSLTLLIVVNAGVAVFGGSGTLGIAWWTPFLGALWAGVLSIGAELAPRFAAELAPGLFSALAGARGREAWATATGTGAAASAGIPAPQAAGAVAGFTSQPDGASASQGNPAPTAEPDQNAAAVPVPAAAPVATPAPLSPAAKRRFLVGASVVGGIAVLTAAAFITVGVLNGTRGPDTAVREYVDALAAGDATKAARLVDPGLPNDERLLLTDAALKSAKHRLEVQSVKTLGTGDASASVEAVLSVDGEKFTHVFTVDRAPNEFLVLNAWRVEDPLLVEVSVGASASDSVMLGEIEVPFTGDDGGSYGTVWVYPGTYEFTAAESTYVTSTPVTARITSDGMNSGGIFVEQKPSEALESLVLKQAQDRITACATVPTNVDDICPYPASSTQLASISLKAQATKLTEITLDSFATDEATITTQGGTLFGFTPAPRDTSFTLGGRIEFADGEPVVTFTHAY